MLNRIKYIPKKGFLLLLSILCFFEIILLWFHSIQGNLNVTYFVGIASMVGLFTYIRFSRRPFARVPLHSRYGYMFVVLFFVGIPLQIYCIGFQLYWLLTYLELPFEVVSTGSKMCSMLEALSSFLFNNFIYCAGNDSQISVGEGKSQKHVVETVSNVLARGTVGFLVSGILVCSTSAITKSDAFLFAYFKYVHRTTEVPISLGAKTYLGSHFFKKTANLANPSDLAIVRKLVNTKYMSQTLPFQKDTFFEGMFIATGIGLTGMISANDLGVSPIQLLQEMELSDKADSSPLVFEEDEHSCFPTPIPEYPAFGDLQQITNPSNSTE